MLRALLASRFLHLALAAGPLALAALPESSAPSVVPGPQPGGARVVDTLADIPMEWRNKNWLGPRGQGSCVHAALVHLLRWQGRHELAEWWARNHGDGESFGSMATELDRAGVRWAGTEEGDEKFLEWAIRSRRGAGVVVANGRHMVNLVGLDLRTAWILDSNMPETIQKRDRTTFLAEWRRSGGLAVTPVYSPAPARPRL